MRGRVREGEAGEKNLDEIEGNGREGKERKRK